MIKNIIILNPIPICCMAFSANYVFMHVNHTVVERNCSEELSLRSPVTRKHKSSAGKALKPEINLLHGIAVLGSGCSLPLGWVSRAQRRKLFQESLLSYIL